MASLMWPVWNSSSMMKALMPSGSTDLSPVEPLWDVMYLCRSGRRSRDTICRPSGASPHVVRSAYRHTGRCIVAIHTTVFPTQWLSSVGAPQNKERPPHIAFSCFCLFLQCICSAAFALPALPPSLCHASLSMKTNRNHQQISSTCYWYISK